MNVPRTFSVQGKTGRGVTVTSMEDSKHGIGGHCHQLPSFTELSGAHLESHLLKKLKQKQKRRRVGRRKVGRRSRRVLFQ